MAQYLLSVWHDDQNFPQTTPEDMERMFAQVGAFNEEVQAAGKWVFAGGLHPITTATVQALVEHRHHVGVREAGGGAGLAVELADEILVVTQTFVHHLDRDGAGQSLVVGEVDGGHAAPSEFARNGIATVEKLPHQGVARAHSGHHRSGQVRGSQAVQTCR